MEAFLLELVQKVPYLGLALMILGSLVVLAQAYILVSPSKEDDAYWEKLKAIPVLGSVLGVLEKFAVIQKK